MQSTFNEVVFIHMSQFIGKYAFEFIFVKRKKVKIIHCYIRIFEMYSSEFKDKHDVIHMKNTMKIVI